MIRPGGRWCGAPTPRSPRDTLPSPRSLYELVGAPMDASALSISAMNNFQTMAGVPGFEPGLSVLETDVLTVDTIPLRRRTRGLGETAPRRKSPCLRVAPSPCRFSLGFLMISVLAATATELTKLQPIGRSFLILSRNVVAAFA